MAAGAEMLIVLCFATAALALPWRYFIGEKPRKSEWQLDSAVIYPTRYSEPLQHTPILPFVPWGLRFDQDIVLSLQAESAADLAMIEVSQLQLASGEQWFILESDLSGQQRVLVTDDSLPTSLFPAPVHRTELSVSQQRVERGLGSVVQTAVTYRRLNGAEISFELDAASAKPTSRSNGHAMNHSQASTLAVLKLDSVRLGELSWQQGGHSLQRILGVPVSAAISQRVIGVRAGSWLQHYGMLGEEEIHPLGRAYQIGEDPAVTFSFLRVEEQLQLSQLVFNQSHPQGVSMLAAMELAQPLPDLRYGVPVHPMETTFRVQFDGQSHANGRLLLEPIDDRQMWVKLIPDRPSWVAARPVWTLLRYTENGIDTHSWVLSPGPTPQHHFRLPEPQPVEEVLSWAGCRWLKTPHRVSHLRIDPSSVALGGGTWANGARATDGPQCRWLTQSVTGVSVVDSPPLVLKPTGHGEVVARARLEVPISVSEGERLIPFLYGLELRAGHGFEHQGITTAGWEAEIEQIVRSSDGVLIDVVLRQRYGSVPDRIQQVELYSAVGQLRVGLLRAATGSELERIENQHGYTEPAYHSLRRLNAPACPEPGPTALMQRWSLQVLDDGRHKGRYIRGFQWSATTEAEDALSMEAAWSRPTRYQLTRTVLQGALLEDRLASPRCRQ